MRLTKRIGGFFSSLSFRADAGLGIIGSPSPDSDYWYHGLGHRSAAGPNVSPGTATRLAAVFACTRVCAETLGSLPIGIYRERKSGGRDAATDHPAQELFLKPNQWQTGMEFFELMQAHLELRGNAYAIKVPGNGRAIDQLIPVHPDRVRVYLLPNSRLRYEVTQYSTGQIDRYTQDEILHMRGWSFDGILGISTVSALAEVIGVGLAQQEHRARYFRNNAIPGMAIESALKQTEEAREKLTNSIEEKFTGEGAFRVMSLPPGMTVKMLGLTNKDSQLIEASAASRVEICGAWRVPPHKIGDLSRGTFCLPGDVLVSTEFGPKPIRDIVEGERVWSMNSEGALVLNKVLRSACTGEDRILTIRAMNRTIRCNAKHKLLVRREIQEEYKGGRGRYHVRKDGWKYRRAFANDYVPAGELKPDDELVAVNALPEQNGTDAPTRKATVPFMEVLGLLLGDGFYARTAKTGKGTTFGISHAENASFMPYYVRQIESLFQRRTLNHSSFNRVLRAHLRDKNTTMFYSQAAYEELEACGLVGTAKTKSIPEWIFGLTNELKFAFLRGYLDADGTIQKDGHHIRYVSVNHDMLDQVRHLCVSAGIHVGNLFDAEITSDFGGDHGEYTHILWGFVCSNIEDLERIGSHTPMYRERIEARRANRFKRTCHVYPSERKLFSDFGPGMHSTAIQSIDTSQDAEPVFDLSVDGDHNFIGELVIIKNSNIEQQNIEFATDCQRPRIVRLERRLDADVVSSLRAFESASGDFFAVFNMDALYRGDMKSRYEAYQLAAQTWMPRNEIRALEGRNPIPGLDEPLVPVNMETISQAQARNTANNARAKASVNTSGEEDDVSGPGSGGAETPENDSPAEDQQNAAVIRQRVRAYALNAADRITLREAKHLRQIASKSGADFEKFKAGVNEFYRDLSPIVAETMLLSKEAAEAYCTGRALTVLTAKRYETFEVIEKIGEDAPALAELALSHNG
jgi:HK97 family phage portal protein